MKKVLLFVASAMFVGLTFTSCDKNKNDDPTPEPKEKTYLVKSISWSERHDGMDDGYKWTLSYQDDKVSTISYSNNMGYSSNYTFNYKSDNTIEVIENISGPNGIWNNRSNITLDDVTGAVVKCNTVSNNGDYINTTYSYSNGSLSKRTLKERYTIDNDVIEESVDTYEYIWQDGNISKILTMYDGEDSPDMDMYSYSELENNTNIDFVSLREFELDGVWLFLKQFINNVSKNIPSSSVSYDSAGEKVTYMYKMSLDDKGRPIKFDNYTIEYYD